MDRCNILGAGCGASVGKVYSGEYDSKKLESRNQIYMAVLSID